MGIACGDNSEEQCIIPVLEGDAKYTQVAAGALHTVLLKNDGSAIACGDNSEEQCNIRSARSGSEWIDESLRKKQLEGRKKGGKKGGKKGYGKSSGMAYRKGYKGYKGYKGAGKRDMFYGWNNVLDDRVRPKLTEAESKEVQAIVVKAKVDAAEAHDLKGKAASA